ncbi:uncharacterized protein ARMOST_13027 [Armillaria ostoyae]|uniref:Uncharacterized protein n=1 Tax=Armillaria ostoyae TaxID=47428 RepID=A0A284RLK1_ARMOS|nr:uncharacterized protein ARMOST_13027 [Armillaria ostoyae]
MGSTSGSSKSDSFTRKDLRGTFRIHPDTLCNTHELLECPCDVQSVCSSSRPELGPGSGDDDSDSESHKGFVVTSQYAQKKKEGLPTLSEWKHINCMGDDNHKDIQDGILQEIMLLQVEEGLTATDTTSDSPVGYSWGKWHRRGS